MLRNHARIGSFTIASQREPIFLGNNDWARGSYDAEFFNDAHSAQVRWLLARHPDFEKKSEIDKGHIYTAEAVAYARRHPLRQAWLVGRRALLFFSPLRDTEDADYLFDWAFATVAILCLIGGAGVTVALPRSVSMLALPVVATFVTCLIVLFLPRYRYPAEPMLVALACQSVAVSSARHGTATTLGAVALLLAASFGVALYRG
jgi:hypothetical protein